MINLVKTCLVVLLLSSLTGCAAFRLQNIPELDKAPSDKQLTTIKQIYVQEVLKPQDSGAYCFGWHGCIWGGRNAFSEILTNQFAQLGVATKFLGLTNQEKMFLHFSDTDEYLLYSKFNNGATTRDVSQSDLDNFNDHPIKKLIDKNNSTKSDLTQNEYWINTRIKYTSNGAGEWFMKSLLTGFTLTLVPIWQTHWADVDISVTNHKQEVIWEKNYKDSYTFVIEFFLLPMAYTATSVPDSVAENMAKTAIRDMVNDGVFMK